MQNNQNRRQLYGSLDAFETDKTELESLREQERRNQQARLETQEPDWLSDFEERPAEVEQEPSWIEQFAIDPLQGTGIPSAAEADPRQELTVPERARRLDYLAQEAESVLGAPVIQGGIENPIQRFRLQGGSRRSNEDIQRSIKEYIPGAETKVVTLPNKTEVIAFRRPDSEGFELINPSGLDFGDTGAALSYLANVEMGASLATTVLTRGFGFVPRLLFQGVSGGAGRFADTEIDKLLGDRPRPIEDTMGDVALSAVLGMAGEGFGTVVSKGFNVLRGGGVMSTTEASRQAVVVSKERGLPGLTLGQRNTLARRAESLFDATTEPLQETYAAQRAAALSELQGYRLGILGQDGALKGMSDEEIETIVLRRTLSIRDSIDNPEVALRRGSSALREGKEQFSTASAELRDRHYTKALDLAGNDVTFNLDETLNVVSKIETGTPRPSRTGRVRRAEGPVEDSLSKLFDDVKDTPRTVTGTEGYQALQVLRTRASNFMRGDYQAANASKRETMNQAARLHASLTEAIENARGPGKATLEQPSSRVAGEFEETQVIQESDFTRAWKRANVFNRWRERMLDMDVMSKLESSTNPVTLMNQFARAGEYQSLRTLKRIMPKEKWKTFVDSFETKLLQNPQKIVQTLDDFADEPEVLNLLIPSVERQMDFRIIGRSTARVNAAANNWMSQTNAGDRAMAMIDSGNKGELVLAIDAAGGPDSVTGKRVRAGIFQKIIERSERVSEVTNQPVANPAKAIEEIDKYLSDESFEGILTKTDISTLKKMRTYLQGIGTLGDDAGSSLAGAETASSFFNIFRPDRMFASGISVQFRNSFLSRVFLNEKFSNFVFGSGAQYKPSTSIRFLSQALATTARDLTQEELETMQKQLISTREEELLREQRR